MQQENGNTQLFKVDLEKDYDVREIIASVYEALTEKGYKPVNQIVGYLMSGDPTYITSHKGARSLIMRAERDSFYFIFCDQRLNSCQRLTQFCLTFSLYHFYGLCRKQKSVTEP